MIDAAYRLRWLLSTAWLCACTTSPAVEALCGDDIDQDGDSMTDCSDPDCHASEDCIGSRAATVSPPVDGGHQRPPIFQNDSGPRDGQVGDAGTQPNDAEVPPGDGQVVPPLDADGGDDRCSACASNEVCVAGACQPAAAPTSGAYHLRLLSGTVPSMDARTFCYDACGIPAGVCSCAPDPYVRIALLRDGQAPQHIDATEVVHDTLEPVFPPVDYPIDLAAGDVLRFDVYDDDEPASDDELYNCNVDLSGILAGETRDTQLACTFKRPVIGGEVTYAIQARLRPRPLIP
jgi:hypothetical protein